MKILAHNKKKRRMESSTTTTKMTTRLKCVDCKLVDCECKDKCFDSLVERKFLIPISEADDERSHGTLLFKWFLPLVKVKENDEIRLVHVSMNKKESVSEEDYVYDVIVPIVNYHGVKRIKLLVEQTEGTEESEIAKKICEAAKDCDMIVMSASQQRGRSNKHIGRVSEAVVHNATTPLLLWRDTEGMREEGMNDRSFREV